MFWRQSPFLILGASACCIFLWATTPHSGPGSLASEHQAALLLANATAASIFPVDTGESLPGWQARNAATLERLISCQVNGASCTFQERHAVLLCSAHFTRVAKGIFGQKAAFPAGEAIWADALIWALQELGYPYLIVDGPDHAQANNRLGMIYRLIGDQVSMVIGDYLAIPECTRNHFCSARFVARGVPDHKLFIFDGFGLDAGHPLGRQWHLTFYPRQDQGFSYLGLTMEHYCKNSSLVPPEGRIDRIYILGKERSYLHPPAIQMFDLGVWERVSRKTGVGFTIGTIQKDDLDAMSLPPGIEDIGSQTRDDFIGQISRHRALLGIGSPPQPSSPLEALCLGTPFINPVWSGFRSQPDRTKWEAQHRFLTEFDPPYVYHYQDHREDDLVAAIEKLKMAPLRTRFIPKDLTAESHLRRIDELIRRDWDALAIRSRILGRPSAGPRRNVPRS